MDAGTLANGAALFGLSPRAVKTARFHAVVVANKLLDDSRTAETLEVSQMNYFQFADLLRQKRFSELKNLSLGAARTG